MLTSRADVILQVSGRCNLSCAYCYQNRRKVRGAMDWRTLTAALRAALAGGPVEVGVEFSGGEPLLEFALLQRAVKFVERHRPRGTKVEFGLTTNGTLLTRNLLSFLVEHRFTIRLSLDGIAAVQDLRAPGTFGVLDRLLDSVRTEFPVQFKERFIVAMTLVAAAIPQLADSVHYLVAKGVGRIAINPRVTWDPDWKPGCRGEMQRQVDEIVELSVDQWWRAAGVPVGFLARPPLRDRDAPVGNFLCGAPAGTGFGVDPDGRVLGCPMLAESMATLPLLAEEAVGILDLGLVTDLALPERLSALPDMANGLRMFTDKRAKRSSYGTCAECRFAADCHVCPASICNIPGNLDPDLVPDFTCAFNQVTLAARERFDEMIGGQASAAWYRDVRAALGELEAAM